MAEHRTTTPGEALAVNPSGRRWTDRALELAHTKPRTLSLRAADRRRIELLVEALIGILDSDSGDADREPDVDHEPEAADPAAWHWPRSGRALCAPIDVLLRGVRS